MSAERIGLVLAGGGARGAYEIGVLAVLLPELERLGQRPKLIMGTSVGAINAAFLASTAHLPARESVALAIERWLDVSWSSVIEHVASTGTVLTGARYAGAVVGIPGVHLHALLDPDPLEGTLDRWIDWERIESNLGAGHLDSIGVATTSAETARSVVFWQGSGSGPVESSSEIDYVRTTIGNRHVRASAAIPIAFPAVEIQRDDEHGGWYFDGGTRLNTPLKPTLDFGADRVVVLATHAIDPRNDSNWHTEGRPPDFGDAAVQLLFAALVDSLINDVRMLAKVNLLAADGVGQTARDYRQRKGRRPHREIPYMFLAPDSRDRIGDLAAEVFDEHFDDLRGFLRAPNIATLARLLGGVTEPHGELLSYLFFARRFTETLIEQGKRDAQSWLERDWGSGGPWLLEPLESLPEKV